jgi:FMN phosphatase YigB (HAD superfamily)
MTVSSRNSTALGAEALLSNVDLVTFDCFGTLVDWEQALPALGIEPGRMPQFLRESELRQRPNQRGAAFIGYRALLEEVGGLMRPDLEPEEVARWARRFGELPFFADVPAGIALLGSVVDVGVISNCDAVHQLDVTRRLGRPWDICVVAEEIGAYKPTDRAWDRAIAMVHARGYDPGRWIHVSAWDDYDLAPAAARGVRTAFIPRPGGVAPQQVDLMFADVLALARTIADVRGGPLAYEVDAEASSGEVMERYLRWLEDEHLADVRACRGVRSAEAIVLDGLRARSSYRFDSRANYVRYLERDAPRLRARGRELFREDEVRFSRIEGVVRQVV